MYVGRGDRLVVAVGGGVHAAVTLVQSADAGAKPNEGDRGAISMHVPQSDDQMRSVRPFLRRYRTPLEPPGEIVEPRRLMMRETQLQSVVALEQRLDARSATGHRRGCSSRAPMSAGTRASRPARPSMRTCAAPMACCGSVPDRRPFPNRRRAGVAIRNRGSDERRIAPFDDPSIVRRTERCHIGGSGLRRSGDGDLPRLPRYGIEVERGDRVSRSNLTGKRGLAGTRISDDSYAHE